MKKIFYTMAAIAGLAVVGNVNAISIGYANSLGGSIDFNGANQFSFGIGAFGNTLQVNSGTAAGDFGTMSGTFTIGTVTTSGGVATAPVTGSGILKIVDGLNVFQGTLTWISLAQFVGGTTSAFNIAGNVNLTGITYAGTNPDLLALAAPGSAKDTLSFTFNPAVSLDDLKGNAQSTTFSGTITTVPDGGTTVLLLGAALSGLGLLRRKLAS